MPWIGHKRPHVSTEPGRGCPAKKLKRIRFSFSSGSSEFASTFSSMVSPVISIGVYAPKHFTKTTVIKVASLLLHQLCQRLH
jgi:hypothetical protein